MVCSTTLSTSFTRSTAVSHEYEKGNSGLLLRSRDLSFSKQRSYFLPKYSLTVKLAFVLYIGMCEV